MSYTYTSWVQALSNEIVVQSTDPNFVGILPSCIDYSENRIYSELDLLTTVTRDSAALSIGNRNFTLPQNNGTFVVTNGINLITPAGTTNPDTGTRTQLLPISRDFLDAVGGSPSYTGAPANFAMITDQTIVVGPAWPDGNYTLEVIGTIRPTPLSALNPQTYLTMFMPQLWFAATMIFMSGYQQNWGAQSDNPQQALSWESQYQALKSAISIEEQRKRYASGAWGSLSPTPVATPSR